MMLPLVKFDPSGRLGLNGALGLAWRDRARDMEEALSLFRGFGDSLADALRELGAEATARVTPAPGGSGPVLVELNARTASARPEGEERPPTALSMLRAVLRSIDASEGEFAIGSVRDDGSTIAASLRTRSNGAEFSFQMRILGPGAPEEHWP
jgi:hypothetical protein